MQCKQNYKRKLEANFSEGNSRQAWKGLRAITGYKAKPRSFSNTYSADAKELCDNLNTFYARFDSKDNYSSLIDELNTVCDNDNCIDISEHEVRLLFKELNSRKSPGPDNISPLLLKCCHNELSGVYQHLFQLSINSGIPRIWKTAVIVPVPKKTAAKEYNDYRPIALTSVPFKCLERILLKHMLPEIEDNLDPYQFSYRKNKSTEDATLLYNNLVVEHLENKNAYVRSVFIDFSSAFNTLKPDIVINKLRTINVSPILCEFILDFLTNREQRVRINDILSSVLSISTGAPQGCVGLLSAILFIIYTNELRSRFRNCHLIKYADDTVIVGLISNNDESEYNEQISEVVQWCKVHHLLLNSIVEICDNFKYLGITFDCKLKWSNHCTLIVSKCKQRLFFLRLLNSFGVKNDILHIFYTSMIESIICYNISLWWSSMNANDKKALNRITKQAAKVTHSELTSIDDLYCNIVLWQTAVTHCTITMYT